MILINNNYLDDNDDNKKDTADMKFIRELYFSVLLFLLMDIYAQVLIIFDKDKLFIRLPLVYNLYKFTNFKLLTFKEYNDDSNSKMDNYDSIIFMN